MTEQLRSEQLIVRKSKIHFAEEQSVQNFPGIFSYVPHLNGQGVPATNLNYDGISPNPPRRESQILGESNVEPHYLKHISDNELNDKKYHNRHSRNAVADIISSPRYPASPELRNVEEYQGVKLEIPRFHIFGIQERTEYDKTKEKLAKKEFRKRGKEFLHESPVILCAIPNNSDGMTLAIIDGHHRTRYAGQFGISEIPSIVFTPEALAKMYNKNQPESSSHIFTSESLIDYLQTSIGETLHSFKEVPDYKQPCHISGISTIEELAEKYPSF